VFFEYNDATGGLSLQILDLGTGGLQTVASFVDFFGRFPAWSRDGNQIAYSGYSGTSREAVYLIGAVPGSTPARLFDGKAPAWSPDDSKLVFVGTSPSSLLTYEFTTGATARIAKGGWMPDWRRF
jgi:Tol biopolymer transport system component